MIYSGLDWSGSPGRAHGPWLVFAIVHTDEADLPTLDVELAKVRRLLRLTPDFPFHHRETVARTRAEFFGALQRIAMTAHVHMLDKAIWSAQYASSSDGHDCICDGIITLLSKCPRHVVDGQMLLIDLPRSQGKEVQRYRTTIRQAMRRAKQPSFRDMRPRPDDRSDGAIIQVADMIAGEVREHAGMAGPFLPSLCSKIHIV